MDHPRTFTFLIALQSTYFSTSLQSLTMSESYYDQRHSNGHGTSAGPPLGAPLDHFHRSQDTSAPSERDVKPDAQQLNMSANSTSNGSTAGGGQGMSGGAAGQQARKKLASWVGFSNLPNQVHRKSVR
jgi:septin 7